MIKKYIRKFLLICIIIQAFTATGLSQGCLNLNLYDFTLNGIPLKELTVDKVTDILGRPSAINTNDVLISLGLDDIGVQVYYFDLGIEFGFKPVKKDPQKRLSDMYVRLSKEWDDYYLKWYQPFSGTITPNLNANMKAGNVVQLFTNYYDIEYSRIFMRCFKEGSGGFSIVYESETQFLESILIWTSTERGEKDPNTRIIPKVENTQPVQEVENAKPVQNKSDI